MANRALDHALETFDCRITVLNIVKPLDERMSEGARFVVGQERIDEADERVNELVARARKRVGAGDQSVETAIETGEPSEAIVTYVEAHDVDHIVMGSHGEGGGELKRRLLGTVSTAVIGETSIPVTLIR